MPSSNEAIGRIEIAEGTVSVIRVDGSSAILNIGDPVFEGDVLRTATQSNVGVTFVDNSTFTLDENGQLALDEMVYDPASETGSFTTSLTSGVFSFVSGQIAKVGPEAMVINTPVATIGIRGTQGLIKQETDGPMRAALMQEADGSTGELILTNGQGTVILNQPNQFSQVAALDALPQQPVLINQVQLVGAFGAKTIQVLNTTRRAAKTRQAEEKKREAEAEEQAAQDAEVQAEEARLAAEEAKAAADEAALAAQDAQDAEAEALLAEAEFLAQEAAAAEAAFLAAQAEAEFLALNAANALEAAVFAEQEAALIAEFEAAFESQISQIEQEINNLINEGVDPISSLFGPGPSDGFTSNPYDNFADANDIFVTEDQFAEFYDEILFFESLAFEEEFIVTDNQPGEFFDDDPFFLETQVIPNDTAYKDIVDGLTSGDIYTAGNEPIDFIAADDPYSDIFVGGIYEDYLYLDSKTTSDITLDLTGAYQGVVNYSNGYSDSFSSIELIQLGQHNNRVNINDVAALNSTTLHGHTSATTNDLVVNVTADIDLGSLAASKFTKLDLSNTAAHVDVSLTDYDVSSFTANQDLYIEGDAGDSVHLGYGFTLSSSDGTYDLYTAKTADYYEQTLYINKAITNVIGLENSPNGGQTFTDVTSDGQTYQASSGTNIFIADDDANFSDTFQGGSGNDTLDFYENVLNDITVDLSSQGGGTVHYGGGAQPDHFSSIEEIFLSDQTNVINADSVGYLNGLTIIGDYFGTTEVHLKNTTAETLNLSVFSNNVDLDLIDMTGGAINIDNLLQLSYGDMQFGKASSFTINGDSGDTVQLNANENWTKGTQGATHTDWVYSDAQSNSYSLSIDNAINVDHSNYAV